MKQNKKQKNIEALLLMAKYDKEFFDILMSDRKKALADAGLDLSAGEKLLINHISEEKLRQTIKNFHIPGITKKSLPSWKKALSVVLLVTSIMATTGCFNDYYTLGILPEPSTESTAEPTAEPT